MKKTRFMEYLRLLRPQGAAATGALVLISSLIMGLRDPFLLFILFIVGILSHTFIFVLNEYADVEVDKGSQDLQNKPLVNGVISKQDAILISIFLGLLAYGLTIVFFQSIFPLLFLSLALLLGGIYDFFGKQIPGSDGFIAGACLFICLFGASTVSIQFTNLVFIVAFSCFFHIMFNNVVEGGLKDVDHDSIAGAKTTATRMGVKLEDGKLRITKRFTVFSYAIKLSYVGLIVLAGFQPELNLWYSAEYLIYIIILFLGVVVFATMYRFWNPPDFNRPRLIKLFAVHEIAAYFLGPIILIPLIGYWLVLLLLIIPLCWFVLSNVVLYGKPMHPQV